MKRKSLNLLLLAVALGTSSMSATEIKVRLIDVNTGLGEKGCQVALLGGPKEKPLKRWLSQYMRSATDGQVRFELRDPLPSFMVLELADDPCVACGKLSLLDSPGAVPTDEVLTTGVIGHMHDLRRDGKPYCHPNLKKLEEIQPKPGEVVLFVRRISLGERWRLAQ